MKTGIDSEGRSPTPRTWGRTAEGRDNVDHAKSAPLPRRQGRPKQRQLAGPRHPVIRVKRRYRVPAARVFAAWLDPGIAGNWLFATALCPMERVEIDARVGGAFCFVERQGGRSIEYVGKYIEIVAHRRLAFTLSLGQLPHVDTRVTVDIAPVRNGCEVSLTHENVPHDHASQLEGRWTGILYGLGETLDPAPTAFTTSGSES
jgi:uncharacterized protein YndB with AHSA1/START domain